MTTSVLAPPRMVVRPRVMSWGLVIVVVALTIGAIGWLRHRSVGVQYITAPVTRGSIVRGVIATGAVNPVVTVQLGSYVSGTIQKLFCDFNTEVKAGQLCAKIDPRPYGVVVDQETANLASARAQLTKDRAALAYATIIYDRDQALWAQGVASQDNVESDKSTFNQLSAQVALDEATIAQRAAALRAAQVNLQYTDIVSPVSGTVISRNIDVGQTVAASFQTPTLFLVAQDLKRMQVDASVSESDIGTIVIGQRATFSVEAYPGRRFSGQVVQLRRAPITVQNVVTYDVVIGIDNADLSLLPGMTANTTIVSARRDSVLRIPLQALRYAPGGTPNDGARRSPRPKGVGKVWVLRNGVPESVPVVIGIDDGTFGELVEGALTAGEPVIVNEIGAGNPSTRAPQSLRSPTRF